MSLETVTALINQFLPEPHAGLLAGILFGVKATMTRDLYDALITTGTLHIVALSGANISILAALVSATLWNVGHMSRRFVGLITVFIIIGFVFFVGPSPSVVRAAIMSCITLLSTLSGRQTWAIWSWILTVCSMLAFSPLLFFDISFQLSAGATLGIILFGQRVTSTSLPTVVPSQAFLETKRDLWSKHLISLFRSIYKFIKADLRITLSAQVFTIPIILVHFHRVSLISPLPNLLIGWILAPLTVLGYCMVLVGLVYKPFGQVFAWVSWVPLEFVLRVVLITAKIPLASISF